MQARLDHVVVAKHARGQARRLVAANQHLHRMLDIHLVTHAVNGALGHHVTIVQEHYAIRHHVHFVQDMTRDDQVQSFGGQLPEQGNRLRADNRIESIQRLIQNQYRRLMCYRLRQAHALAHAFAVGADAAIGGRNQIDALQSFRGQFVSFLACKTGNHQKRFDEFAARQSARKRIKL